MTYTVDQFTQDRMLGLLAESSHRNLTVVSGDPLSGLEQQKYHLSLIVLYSPMLGNILEDVIPTPGEDITLYLPDIETETVTCLMDCLYTGQCMIGDSAMGQRVVTLKEDIGLNIDINIHVEEEDDDTIPSMPSDLLIEELEAEENRLTKDIMAFIDNMGEIHELPCTECGETLDKDNFIGHYRAHVEDLQEAREKINDDFSPTKSLDEIKNPRKDIVSDKVSKLNSDVETRAKLDNSGSTKSDLKFNNDYEIRDTLDKEDSTKDLKRILNSDPDKMSDLEEKQVKMSNDISKILSIFERGVISTKCYECSQLLSQDNFADHYKTHITNLKEAIAKVSQNKQDSKRKANENIKTDDGKSRKTDTTAVKEESKVNNEKLNHSKSKKSRQDDSNESTSITNEVIDDVTLALAEYVTEGTKEYRHEWKKAHDRLYKRGQRVSRMNGGKHVEILKQDVKLEILTHMRLKNTVKIKKEVVEEEQIEFKNNDGNNSYEKSNPWWSMIGNNDAVNNTVNNKFIDNDYHDSSPARARKMVEERLLSSNNPMSSENYVPSSEKRQLSGKNIQNFTLDEDFDDTMVEDFDDTVF